MRNTTLATLTGNGNETVLAPHISLVIPHSHGVFTHPRSTTLSNKPNSPTTRTLAFQATQQTCLECIAFSMFPSYIPQRLPRIRISTFIPPLILAYSCTILLPIQFRNEMHDNAWWREIQTYDIMQQGIRMVCLGCVFGGQAWNAGKLSSALLVVVE